MRDFHLNIDLRKQTETLQATFLFNMNDMEFLRNYNNEEVFVNGKLYRIQLPISIPFAYTNETVMELILYRDAT